MSTYSPPGGEKFIPDLAAAMNADDVKTLVFSMSTYQIFDETAPTAVFAYGGNPSGLGLLVWNLLPGQENDYHLHPASEHVQIVIQGEVEYTLADEEPVILKAGDAVMVPPGVPHGIRNVSDAPASYFAATTSSTGAGYEKVVVDRPER